MNKDFLIALGVTLVFYAGYSYFFPPKQAEFPPNAQAVIEEQAASNNPKIKVTASNSSQEEEEKLYTLELKDADITFSSKGAAIKTYEFKDTVAKLNLTPYGGTGYFATMPELNFKKVEDEAWDMAFEAVLQDTLSVKKGYYFDKDGGLNKLSLTVKNIGDKNIEISDVFVNMGPGLATVESEMSENSANMRAICLCHGKRHNGKDDAETH